MAAPLPVLFHADLDVILDSLKQHGVGRIDVGVLAGSGLMRLADSLEVELRLDYADIDGYPATSIPGHPGRLVIGRAHDKRVAVFLGRFHLYEGIDGARATLPVQVAAALGARTMILTSSVGAINADFGPGDPVLVTDHLNLMGSNPLIDLTRRCAVNPYSPDYTSPFVDLTRAYRADLYDALNDALRPDGPTLRRGVLAAMIGPNYETPAEVRMLRAIGADVVCMSSVPEAIYARYLGLDVLALALVTNRANDGTAAATVSHQEVLQNAAAGSRTIARLVAAAIGLV